MAMYSGVDVPGERSFGNLHNQRSNKLNLEKRLTHTNIVCARPQVEKTRQSRCSVDLQGGSDTCGARVSHGVEFEWQRTHGPKNTKNSKNNGTTFTSPTTPQKYHQYGRTTDGFLSTVRYGHGCHLPVRPTDHVIRNRNRTTP